MKKFTYMNNWMNYGKHLWTFLNYFESKSGRRIG